MFDESINGLYVMANESYEDFARALQTEYEEDCGVSFGKVPLTALAKLSRVVDGVEQPVRPGLASVAPGRSLKRASPRDDACPADVAGDGSPRPGHGHLDRR